MRRLALIALLVGIGFEPLATAAPAPAPFDVSRAITELPELQVGQYRVDPYLRIAAELQALGEVKAIEALRSLAQERRSGDRAIVLCRMLFSKKPGGEFRRPLIGGAIFFGGTTYADWPLEPIEIVEGVPFLITRGYVLGGEAEPPSRYLEYCLKTCTWSVARFGPRTSAEKRRALATLLASSKWKQKPSRSDQEFLSAQLQSR